MSALSETAEFLIARGADVDLQRDDADGGFLWASLGEREASVDLFCDHRGWVTSASAGVGAQLDPDSDLLTLTDSSPLPCGAEILALLEGGS